MLINKRINRAEHKENKTQEMVPLVHNDGSHILCGMGSVFYQFILWVFYFDEPVGILTILHQLADKLYPQCFIEFRVSA